MPGKVRAAAVGLLVVAVAVPSTAVGAAPGDDRRPRVAVVDGGVLPTALPNVTRWTCRPGCRPGQSKPALTHGTDVTALLLAAAPRASVTSFRVDDARGVVDPGGVRSALRHLARSGRTDVVVVSLTVTGGARGMDAWIRRMPGTLVVAAAGNDSRLLTARHRVFPCQSSAANVLCVGASDHENRLAAFSNWSRRYVDVVAPGVSITVPLATRGSVSGTSFAAPQVAGLAAQIRGRRPRAGVAQIVSALRRQADPSPSLRGTVSWGAGLRP